MVGLSSVASKTPGAVTGELAKKSLSALGSGILTGLGTGGSLNFGSAESGADDAQESGKQTGPTGDKSKDVINALRDLQSDVNKQSAALKKNNGLLAKQTDILSKGFEALIKSNDKNTELLSQMSGGGSLGDLLKSAAPSILPSLASPAAVTAIAAIAAAAAYELYKSGKEYLDIPNRPDFEKLKQKSAGLTEQEEINSAWASRGKAMGGSTSLPSGAAGVGAGRGTPEFAEKPGERSYAMRMADISSQTSPLWQPKQIAPPPNAGAIGKTPGAPRGSAAPAATETQKAYHDKMYNALYAAAKEKGLPNPEVIAQLGATQTSLETGYGRHMVGNNAFGIKGSGANSVSAATQEFEGGRMVTKNQNFKTYNNATDSAADYVDFLIKNPRYKNVLAATNINEAIDAQSKTGYATDPDYGSKLASINRKMSGAGGQGGMQVAGASGVNTELSKAFQTAASEYYEATGKHVQINSGVRDSAKQAKLYKDYIEGRSPYPAARPGTSKHEHGLAIDINRADAEAMDKMGILAKYGLSRPVRGDPVHIEMAGLGGGNAMAYAPQQRGGAAASPAGRAISSATGGSASLSGKESSTLKQAMASSDPHVKSRAMFQAAQDAEARGENSTALFWAADKQRQAELANVGKQQATQQAGKTAAGSESIKPLKGKVYTDSVDINAPANEMPLGDWQKTDVTTNPDASAYPTNAGTYRPGAAAEAALPAVGYDLVDASRVAPGDIEDRTKALTDVGGRFRGGQVNMGREAIQKSQNTEPGYSGSSGQTLQNAVNTPAEPSSDNSQSSIKPEDTSIGAQEFNRIFGNFYNATAGW